MCFLVYKAFNQKFLTTPAVTNMPTDALEVRESSSVAMETASSSWVWVPMGAEEEVTCAQCISCHFRSIHTS